MPAVGEPYDATARQIDVLAPRDLNNPSLTPRQAIDFPAVAAPPLAKRQQQLVQQGIIPTYYNLDGPEPGTVVGIVLGSVAGFLLIVWLLYSLTQGNRRRGTTTAMAGEEEIVVRRARRNSQARSRRSSHTQMREHSRSSPRMSSSRSQVVVEERRAPPPQQRQRSVTRQRSIVVEDRHRVPGDDVVEVIEEHDDFRARRGGRKGGYR
ncbi:hypothetical protein P153DRAFT_135644 [Dothidotthia symphoricarpi CBS 119687]|uniref:Uncharacterized protein n=1 Tax=Dothidotthia symphoricarpi CBS 119687 TaxID=1392245 RepID=A0A6A5ZZ01_9PLEO|nr:uncharacterized protein P153DRAFT_135644 [Dothidotthia symphoricarpi CBS 119687]KAF2124124.1 hypothetical protein P153DRAFT_135644 [Dothidotthia symphoricarpi CBS 119687]